MDVYASRIQRQRTLTAIDAASSVYVSVCLDDPMRLHHQDKLVWEGQRTSLACLDREGGLDCDDGVAPRDHLFRPVYTLACDASMRIVTSV